VLSIGIDDIGRSSHRLPDVYADTDALPNGGMIEHTLDDHFIQVDMSFDLAFASMLVDEADQ